MKNVVFYSLIGCIIIMVSGVLISFITFCNLHNHDTITRLNTLAAENTKLKEELDIANSYLLSIPVAVTAYNPTKVQCDNDPLVTASLTKVEDGIIALSRDLEETLHLKFGDLVTLRTPGGELIGSFRFQDRMHRRWTRRVDIFMWEKKDALNFGIKYASMFIQRVNSAS